MLLKILQSSQERPVPQTLAHVFSCEFCEMFKSTFFRENLQVTASVYAKVPVVFNVILNKYCLHKRRKWFIVRLVETKLLVGKTRKFRRLWRDRKNISHTYFTYCILSSLIIINIKSNPEFPLSISKSSSL